jgi:hypothetical protein
MDNERGAGVRLTQVWLRSAPALALPRILRGSRGAELAVLSGTIVFSWSCSGQTGPLTLWEGNVSMRVYDLAWVSGDACSRRLKLGYRCPVKRGMSFQ